MPSRRLYGSGQGVDPVTVADELDQAGVLESVGGPATLVTLQARTPAITNALHYAKIVEEKSLLRKLITTANDVAELGYSPLDDIEKTIDSAESMMFAVAQRRNADSMAALAPLLDRSLEQLEMLYERGDAITGTPTGYTDLDTQLAGLQPGALIVVGARPAMGKCLAWDTPIVDPDTGAVRTMASAHLRGRLGVTQPVFALGEDLRLTTAVPSDHIDDGLKPVFRVTTALGRTVRCTLTHPFRTIAGWQPLSELVVGERIAAPRELPVFGTEPLPEHEVSLLGLLLGDGTLTVGDGRNGSIRFTNRSDEIVAEATRRAPSSQEPDGRRRSTRRVPVQRRSRVRARIERGARARPASRSRRQQRRTRSTSRRRVQPAEANSLRCSSIGSSRPMGGPRWPHRVPRRSGSPRCPRTLPDRCSTCCCASASWRPCVASGCTTWAPSAPAGRSSSRTANRCGPLPGRSGSSARQQPSPRSSTRPTPG